MRFPIKPVLIVLITIVLPSTGVYSQPTESIGGLHPIIGEFHTIRSDWFSPIDESVSVERMSFHYIGATIDGEWFGDLNGSSGREVQKAVESENPFEYTYDLYSLDGFVGTATLSNALEWQSEPSYYAIPDVEIYPNELLRMTGISCDWDPMPRLPQFDDPSQEIYLNALWSVILEVDEDLLNNYDYLSDPYNQQLLDMNYRVDEVFLIDLDDDGTEESIITGSVGENFENRSDYCSVIILIRDSQVIPLFNGDLYTLITIQEPMSPCLLGFIDANGDGSMEILANGGCCSELWSVFTTLDAEKISRQSYLNNF